MRICRRFFLSAGLGSLILLWLGVAGAATSQRVQLWFYLHTYLQNASQYQFCTNLLTRAAAAGYSGCVLADSMLESTNGGTPFYNTNCLQPFLALAGQLNISVLPMTASFGHSESALVSVDKNFAEPQPVNGTVFVADTSSHTLVLSNSFVGLTNGAFESYSSNRFSVWDFQDAIGLRTFVDTNVFHGGAASLRIDPDPYTTNKNARLLKRIAVQPWRQYHVRVWMQFTNFSTAAAVTANPLDVVFLDFPSGDARNFTGNNGPFATASGSYPANQTWTQYDYVCNSMGSTNITFALGLWSNSTGHLWVDDVSIEEVALVNLVRRTGAALKLYDAVNTNRLYSEPGDVNSIADSAIPAGGPFDAWHVPPTVTLPAGTTLTNGQRVKMDFYAVNPVNMKQVGACCTAPGVASYLSNNIASLAAKFPTNTGFVLDIDEWRHVDTCATCAALGQSSGGVLAWCLALCTNLIHGISPSAPVYVWNDMYDPYQNAISNTYYFANGPMAGSWSGFPSNVIVMNWNHPNSVVNTNSLNFFASLGCRQFITGYYDTGTGTLTASNELRAAQGVPGFLGLMYTTWNSNLTNGFAQLENYAAATQLPSFSSQPTNLTVNAGQTAVFAASAAAPTPLTFQWQRNGVDIPGATNATYSFVTAPADHSAQFGCRASDYGGWSLSASAVLSVISPAPARLMSVAPPAGGRFHLGFTGSQAFAYSLQASTNLLDWSVIASGLVGSNGWFGWDDLAATNLSARYYRVVWP